MRRLVQAVLGSWFSRVTFLNYHFFGLPGSELLRNIVSSWFLNGQPYYTRRCSDI